MNGKELKEIVDKANDKAIVTLKYGNKELYLYGVMDDFLGTKFELEFKEKE